MEEWKEVKLGDVCDLIAGYAFKATDFGTYPQKVIRIGDINPPFVNASDAIGVDIDKYDFNKLRKYIVSYGDFVLAMTGATIGKVGRYTDKFDSLLNQRVLLFKPKTEVFPSFIYYIVSSNKFQQYVINHIDSQSAQPNISANTLSKYVFKIPATKEKQSRVASILKSLDDKIENNRKINENLEQQAQALFKSWFVDFEPFRDQPFVESELGMIPEGWRVGTLSEFGTIICGKTPSKANPDYYDGDYPFIKIPDMHGNIFPLKHEEYISEIGAQSQPNKLIPPFSLLVSCIATVGLVSINTVPSFTNQQINSIIVINESSLYYLYLLLSEKTDELQNLGRGGTATLNVNTKIFSNIKVIIPSDNILILFNEITSPVFSKILNNAKESLRLSQLRDTLLPRLMSGELSVK